MAIEVRYINSTENINIHSDHLKINITTAYVRELVLVDELTAKKILHNLQQNFEKFFEEDLTKILNRLKQGVESGLL